MRATFNSSGIQKRYWHEVLKSCCLGLNQIPRKGLSQSPWEILHGKPFPSKLLKPIGTRVIILNIIKNKGQKFDSKGEEGKLVGFNPAFRSYRIITQSGRIVETKYVQFLKKPELPSIAPDHFDNSLNFRSLEEPPQVENATAKQQQSPDHGENNSYHEDSKSHNSNSEEDT